jgi:tetratricopeptide (TPR) repeat protein
MKQEKRNSKQVQIFASNPPVDPTAMEQPADPAAYLRRGYAFYGTSEYEKANEDFRQTLDLDPTSVDAVYGLGMSLKALGNKTESVAAFTKVIGLIDREIISDKSRARILRRLALGHINEINTGDWNLEAEIWQRIA